MTNSFGGYWNDEYYFIVAGRHLAWSYADQPPLVPLLAGALDAVFPGSEWALRLPSTLMAGVSVLVVALTARELGGHRCAQVVAAGAYAVSGWLLPSAHWLTTYAIDPFWWLLVSWLVVRWTRKHAQGLHDDRPLLWAGIVTAVALQTKYLIPVLWLAIGIGVLISGPRPLLFRPSLWAGALIAIGSAVPGLVWQAAHGWPFLRFSQTVSAESDRTATLVSPPLYAGALGTLLLVYGLWRLFRAAELRPYRFLAWTFFAVVGIVTVVDGRAYYPVGLYGTLIAAGAVEFARRDLARWWTWVAWPAYALSACVAVWTMLYLASTVDVLSGRHGVQPAADLYHRALTPEQRAHTVIVTDLYLEAATFDHFQRELALPEVYSPHRGYRYFGTPPDDADVVLYVSTWPNLRALDPYFTRAQWIGADRLGISLSVLSGRRQPWSEIWRELEPDAVVPR
ncbi:ArnT family glycosyltransferase [Amycolatopsis sp. NPDC059021]|uniref:ArnT family glycosyltransferase n=1 Tax=Amycolatopsis sp. NPDC059021 TaxID=3346704 RepID=UPI00366EC4B1